MKKFLIAIPLVATLAACNGTTPSQGALTGAALGAATGAAFQVATTKFKARSLAVSPVQRLATTSARPSPANAFTRTRTVSATSQLAHKRLTLRGFA